MPLLAAFFAVALTFLGWLVFAALAFWTWKTTRSKAHLVTMIGAGLLAFAELIVEFGTTRVFYFWLQPVGVAFVVYGYYLNFRAIIDARIHELKVKASAPPAAVPPPVPPLTSPLVPAPPAQPAPASPPDVVASRDIAIRGP